MGLAFTDNVRAWVRYDLGGKYGDVLKEDVPQDMLELLRMSSRQG